MVCGGQTNLKLQMVFMTISNILLITSRFQVEREIGLLIMIW